MKTKKYIWFFLAAVFSIIAVYPSAFAQDELPEPKRLLFFYSPGCHECSKVNNEVIPRAQRIFKEKIEVEYRDISDIQNYKMLLGLKKEYGLSEQIGVPVIFLEGSFLIGESEIKVNLIPLAENVLKKPAAKDRSISAGDILSHFQSFAPFAIIGAGLIDGINPCAFTVMVFFISFLSLHGYRKKELIITGFAFITAVFLTYLVIGLGLFNFLYRLKIFLHLARMVNFAIGIFCIVLGVFALYDFFEFKKSGRTEGLVLQLPGPVKTQIQRIIGLFYRRTQKINQESAAVPAERLLFGTLIAGFLVSLLEAVCTGQVYLPTIVFVLKTTRLKLEALGYLLLYNLMFIIPLFIIFIFALLGATSAQFARFLNKNLLAIKMLMAVLFFSLGIFLVWRA